MEIGGLVGLLVWLAIIGLILFIVWWGISQIPLPEPISTVVRVIFVLVCCIIAIDMLLQFLPGGAPGGFGLPLRVGR